jgi:hypothetical protein
VFEYRWQTRGAGGLPGPCPVLPSTTGCLIQGKIWMVAASDLVPQPGCDLDKRVGLRTRTHIHHLAALDRSAKPALSRERTSPFATR